MTAGIPNVASYWSFIDVEGVCRMIPFE